MLVRHVKPLLAVALVAGSLSAIASPESGIYAGASLGTQKYPDTVNGISGNESATSGKLFAGYQVNPNFAIEAGLVKFGKVSNNSGQIDAHSQFLDAVGILPLDDKWSLLGRLGVAHVQVNTSQGDDGGNGLKAGLGVQYALANNMAIRGEWERYQLKTFSDTPDTNQYTVGLTVGF
jgi:OmpA-OmpF porin, OOP family